MLIDRTSGAAKLALPPVAEVSSSQASVASVAAFVAAAAASTGISADLLAAANTAGHVTLPAIQGAKGPSATGMSTTSQHTTPSVGSLPLVGGQAPGHMACNQQRPFPGPLGTPAQPSQPLMPRQHPPSPRTLQLSPQRLATRQRLREQIAALGLGAGGDTTGSVTPTTGSPAHSGCAAVFALLLMVGTTLHPALHPPPPLAKHHPSPFPPP